jgi:hypothetical protein
LMIFFFLFFFPNSEKSRLERFPAVAVVVIDNVDIDGFGPRFGDKGSHVARGRRQRWRRLLPSAGPAAGTRGGPGLHGGIVAPGSFLVPALLHGRRDRTAAREVGKGVARIELVPRRRRKRRCRGRGQHRAEPPVPDKGCDADHDEQETIRSGDRENKKKKI